MERKLSERGTGVRDKRLVEKTDWERKRSGKEKGVGENRE